MPFAFYLMNSDDPVLIMGDFNTPEINWQVKYMIYFLNIVIIMV